jgi:hypothetical protein
MVHYKLLLDVQCIVEHKSASHNRAVLNVSPIFYKNEKGKGLESLRYFTARLIRKIKMKFENKAHAMRERVRKPLERMKRAWKKERER